jgi:hypothetical protein
MGTRRADAQADLSVCSARANCIVAHESGSGDATAVNPRSGAAGLGQFLAECTCGWRSVTGGAVKRHVEALVANHKLDVSLDGAPQ